MCAVLAVEVVHAMPETHLIHKTGRRTMDIKQMKTMLPRKDHIVFVTCERLERCDRPGCRANGVVETSLCRVAKGLVARSGENVNGTLRLPRAWMAISSGEGLGVSSASDKFTVQLTLSVMSVGCVGMCATLSPSSSSTKSPGR